MPSLSAKTKRGGRVPSRGKRSFGGRQKFLTGGLAGGSKIWPGDKNYFQNILFDRDLFESKTKKLCNFKVGQFGICEKHGCGL